MNFPDRLIGGPDDIDDGIAWVEPADDDRFVAVSPTGGLTPNHPDRRYILEEMVRRYNEFEHPRAKWRDTPIGAGTYVTSPDTSLHKDLFDVRRARTRDDTEGELMAKRKGQHSWYPITHTIFDNYHWYGPLPSRA